jgi:hypothetical protein
MILRVSALISGEFSQILGHTTLIRTLFFNSMAAAVTNELIAPLTALRLAAFGIGSSQTMPEVSVNDPFGLI